jgi:hypothetical protein
MTAASPAAGNAIEGTDRRLLVEPQREVPVVEVADVVVCGGGPAGVTAAIAAARTGAKTRLIEVNGCLGGVWTAGLLSWILDSGNKPGIMQEIIVRLKDRGATARYGGSVGYDVEQMKIVLDEMCREAGVQVRLHTRVVAAAKDQAGRLNAAITESKSGREAFAGAMFVDASGDGDLAARAGCRFDYGHPQTHKAQPMSMIALLAGIEADEVAPFVRGLAEPRKLGSPKDNLLAEMRKAGVDPSYSRPTLFYIRQGLFCMMANHEYEVCGMNADEVTAATLRGRAEVHQLINALRKLGDPWKNVRIIVTAEHIGVREGRRISGHYTVSTADLANGARHADAVCRCEFPVDVHSIDPTKDKGIPSQGVRALPYDIPYRALIAKDVDGLLLAGRCISGDFIAHSSYRVTGDAVAMGEAAGAAAAVAARTARLPQEVPWPELKAALSRSNTAQES